ncbi:hypothetical protein H0920_02890 [Acinetobacter sp. C_4_1]|uniref:hypothetical protein n=1 Tax=unclassified Acinetobacter TaxID=196816 RepID=UPI0021B783C6|nr:MULTISPECIES: hypothetical protein [unclassified Acinetobacter]MCT8088801.1 hypothetical protein [Acinetobacter sp. F_3_1]MCT8096957.1 hypothetical protein [Acinetobacter sp. C_3_1]MCT8100050.1 hypothetical protein [Acinetobacter sp. C_4_1]MCT8134448.1 hypothetical protein [Acinetobacter sp. T_3_1]
MTKRTLFALGQVVSTPNALRFAEAEYIDLLALLVRHQGGDWGDVSEEDRESNEEALLMPLRIMSSYKFSNDKIWIITEADRSVTTILLPNDY